MIPPRRRPTIRRIGPAPAATVAAASAVPRFSDEIDDELPTAVGPLLAPDKVRELMDDAEKVAARTTEPKKPMPPRPQSGLRRCVRPEDLAPKPAPRPSASAIELDIEVDLSTLEPVIEVQHLHASDIDHDPDRDPNR